MATGSYPIAKKSLGQHWLVDQGSLQAICRLAELTTEDVVLEIGPGTGNLTRILLQKTKKITAVELDTDLAASLEEKNLEGLKVLNQDILSFNLSQLPEGYKIVANIPYYLTGKLIRAISQTANRPKLAILLVQKEIAERLTAVAGAMSVLSVSSQFFWQIDKGPLVTADKFEPPPKVDSQIVILRWKQPDIDSSQQPAFFRLVKIGFAAKRKTLLNNIAAGYHLDKDVARELLAKAKINSSLRPQNLAIIDWLNLLSVLA